MTQHDRTDTERWWNRISQRERIAAARKLLAELEGRRTAGEHDRATRRLVEDMARLDEKPGRAAPETAPAEHETSGADGPPVKLGPGGDFVRTPLGSGTRLNTRVVAERAERDAQYERTIELEVRLQVMMQGRYRASDGTNPPEYPQPALLGAFLPYPIGANILENLRHELLTTWFRTTDGTLVELTERSVDDFIGDAAEKLLDLRGALELYVREYLEDLGREQ